MADLALLAARSQQDLAPHETLWAAGAEGWTLARSEQPHTSDVLLSPERHRVRAQQTSAEDLERAVLSLTWIAADTNPGVDVTFQASLLATYGAGEDLEQTQLTIRATAQDDGAWKAVSVRSWGAASCSVHDDAACASASAEVWEALDRDLARARAQAGEGDRDARRALAQALTSAHYLERARVVARELVAAPDATDADHDRLRFVATMLGGVDARDASFIIQPGAPAEHLEDVGPDQVSLQLGAETIAVGTYPGCSPSGASDRPGARGIDGVDCWFAGSGARMRLHLVGETLIATLEELDEEVARSRPIEVARRPSFPDTLPDAD